MNKVEPSYFMACLALFFLAGCAQTQQDKTVEQILLPDMDQTEAMQTAQEVLGRMHFAVDKADVEQGLIRTRPLPGAQFFEFWRSENVDAVNSFQANLHSIRRTVELDINRRSGRLCIACDVKVERLSLPEHDVSSSARAYEMFSKSTASMQKLQLRPDQKKQMAWLDLGRDSSLATVILKRIEEQIATSRKEKKP